MCRSSIARDCDGSCGWVSGGVGAPWALWALWAPHTLSHLASALGTSASNLRQTDDRSVVFVFGMCRCPRRRGCRCRCRPPARASIDHCRSEGQYAQRRFQVRCHATIDLLTIDLLQRRRTGGLTGGTELSAGAVYGSGLRWGSTSRRSSLETSQGARDGSIDASSQSYTNGCWAIAVLLLGS
jgi:hypothetical protein